MKLIFYKRMDTSLKGEVHLRLKLQSIAHTEPPTSIFYMKPTQYSKEPEIRQAIQEMNDKKRKGMMNQSAFSVEMEGKRVKVYKLRNEKEPEIFAEFQFGESLIVTAEMLTKLKSKPVHSHSFEGNVIRALQEGQEVDEQAEKLIKSLLTA